MEQELLNLVKDYGVVNYTFIFILIGMLFDIFISLINSFIMYLSFCTWLKNDYEKIIYYNVSPDSDNLNNKEKELVLSVNNSFSEYLKRKEKRSNFFKKIFRRKKS